MFGRKRAAEEDPFAALNQGGTYQSTPTTTVAGIPGSGLDNEPTAIPSAAPIPAAPSAPSPTTEPTISSTFAAVTPTAPPSPTPTVVTPSVPTNVPSTPPVMASSRWAKRGSMGGVRMNAYRTSGVRAPGRLIIWLIVLGVGAAIVVPIISATNNAIHAFSVPAINVPSPSIPSFSTPAVPTAPAAPSSPKVHVNYLKTAGVRAGLKAIAKRFPGAKVTNLRLDGTSLSTFVFPRGGGVKDVSITPSRTFISSASPTGERPFAASAIPAGAIARIVTAMKAQFHVPAKKIDYIVLSTIPGLPTQWIAFSKAPSHPGFAANIDGSGLHSLGG
jgi:hypothetical protein